MAHTTPKDRIITAALRVAAAERGGLDGRSTDVELENAHGDLDDEIERYVEENFTL